MQRMYRSHHINRGENRRIKQMLQIPSCSPTITTSTNELPWWRASCAWRLIAALVRVCKKVFICFTCVWCQDIPGIWSWSGNRMTVFRKLNTKTKGKENFFLKVTLALSLWKALGSYPGWWILQSPSDQPVGAHAGMKHINSGML